MRKLAGQSVFFSFLLAACASTTAISSAADASLLERDVLPVLTKNCLGCHGGLVKEGGLDLRTLPAMLKGGESGPAVESGKADASELWKRIANDEMPSGDDREKLSAADKAVIKNWVEAGMPTVAQRHAQVNPRLPAGKRHEPAEVAAAIDQHIEQFLADAGLSPTERTTDDEFLRRVYVDVTGRIPTAEQAVAFLDSDAPDRRAKLIDTLLARAEFGEQFGRTWRDWISPPELPSDNNGGAQPIGQAKEFGSWLGKKFAAGESWDKITRDVLTVQGEIKDQPQVIFFGLVGEGGKTTADGSARAVASTFLGVQLHCARCHDDPYRDWSQAQHWGMAAFFGRTQGDFKKIEIGKGPSKTAGEISIPGSAFRNVGVAVKATFLRGPELSEQKDGDLRKPFVDWLVAKENPYFARSFANRLWFYLFARGIVNPIDDFRELNPPSHPGLMKLLANEFAASNYDIKHLFRCICNSGAYQRSSRVSAGTDAPARDALTTMFGRMPMRLMTADMLFDSLKQAYGDPKLDLRTNVKHSTVGMAAPVGDPWLEFQRRFGTNEEDPTDFTHGIAQMLTMINHPRLLAGSKGLDKLQADAPRASAEETVEWLYLSTLSRRPDADELKEAVEYVQRDADAAQPYNGVLWMLVNRSEFILIR